MLIRPDRNDLRIIAFYVGKVLVGVGFIQIAPLVVAVARQDWNDATAFVLGMGLAVGLGRLTEWRFHTTADLAWSHGLVAVALSWALGTAVAAVPLYLSGHFASYLDATLDTMSGFTATGLTILQDIDHLSVSMNLFRHILQFAGGQGIVIVVLTVLASSSAQVATLYVGEGREERILPNIVRTARFIYLVASVWLVVGTAFLWAAGMVAGLTPGRALFHGLNIFMAAFDTGGFATTSASIGYYHSAVMESVVMVIMVAGTLSFGLHYELWRGRRRELFENLETRSLAVTGFITTVVVVLGLARAGTFTDLGGLYRKGIFTIVSAHTNTGFTVNSGRLFVTDWGLIAPAAIVLAMGLGGMASSTAGGIKAIRVGLAAKAVVRDIRRAIQPDAAVVLASYTHRTRRILGDTQVRAAITILVLYLLLYLAGAVLGVYYGHPFDEALFESTSAASNAGMSVGVLTPTTPIPMKLFFTFQMWIGRLEFMSVFALLGYGLALWRGKL